ncbi:MAG: tRNA pseudouridine(55) synthase TruB [Opitutaceae bacterium]|nr:tRNA pseudouridine(55) synthase TruB [Cytophagales bacterium]
MKLAQFPDFNFSEGEILLFDKPLTWTSFDVVNKIRGCIKVKKVGHAGTLDPLATGLLLLCTGKMTKTIDLIQATEKEYLVNLVLGKTTPSYDLESEFDSETSTDHLSEEEVKLIILSFHGVQQQFPPMFSAIKVNGERLYSLARQGKEIELQSREVEIKSISEIKINLPEVQFLMTCTKGTYVRSLVHDIGKKLGVGAYMSALRRTKVGEYCVENSYQITDFVNHIKSLNVNVINSVSEKLR